VKPSQGFRAYQVQYVDRLRQANGNRFVALVRAIAAGVVDPNTFGLSVRVDGRARTAALVAGAADHADGWLPRHFMNELQLPK
jgi:hypothetical protein